MNYVVFARFSREQQSTLRALSGGAIPEQWDEGKRGVGQKSRKSITRWHSAQLTTGQQQSISQPRRASPERLNGNTVHENSLREYEGYRIYLPVRFCLLSLTGQSLPHILWLCKLTAPGSLWESQFSWPGVWRFI